MPSSDNDSVALYGPWKGIVEYPLTDDESFVEDALNVEFDGEVIRRRKGRQIFSQPTTLRPCVVQLLSGGNYTDVTADLTDGVSTTTTPPTFYFQAGQEIFIGFACPVNGLRLTVSAANAAAQGATALYWNGTAWVTLVSWPSVAFPTATNYDVSWVAPSDWKRSSYGAFADLYWVRITATGVFTSTFAISDIRGGLAGKIGLLSQDQIRMTAGTGNGLFDYVQANGNHQILMAMDDVSGLYGAPLARLFVFDEGSNELVSVNLPADAKSTGSDAKWRFVVFENNVIATNGYGPIIRHDGTNCYRLEATAGTDNASQAYLTSVPRGKYLAVYNQCLYVSGNPLYPQTVFQSMYSNADAIIPADGSAPVGGANVWPADKNFDCTTAGGEPITGMKPMSGWLSIFKSESIWNWDDSSLFKAVNGVGCVSSETIQPIQTPTGNKLLFLGQRSVYAFDGLKIEEIGIPLQRTFLDQVNLGATSGAVAVKYAKRRQYRLSVPTRFSTKNKLTLVYSYDKATWTKFGSSFLSGPGSIVASPAKDMEIASFATAAIGVDDERLLSADSQGNIWIEDNGHLDGAYPIPWYVLTKPIGMQDGTPKRWRRVRIERETDGSTFGVYALMDGNNISDTYQLTGTVPTITNGSSDGSVLQYGINSVVTQADGTPIYKPKLKPVRVDLAPYTAAGATAQTVSRYVRLLLYDSGVSQTAGIRGLTVEFRTKTGGR